MKSTKKVLELANKFNQIAEYKINIQKTFLFPYLSNNNWKVPLKIFHVSQHTKDEYDKRSGERSIQWKPPKFLREIFWIYVSKFMNWLENSILQRCLFHPQWSTHSKELQSKSQEFFCGNY
jgi:hypothetical protein